MSFTLSCFLIQKKKITDFFSGRDTNKAIVIAVWALENSENR